LASVQLNGGRKPSFLLAISAAWINKSDVLCEKGRCDRSFRSRSSLSRPSILCFLLRGPSDSASSSLLSLCIRWYTGDRLRLLLLFRGLRRVSSLDLEDDLFEISFARTRLRLGPGCASLCGRVGSFLIAVELVWTATFSILIFGALAFAELLPQKDMRLVMKSIKEHLKCNNRVKLNAAGQVH
jgi:hypothetical protein